jgi:hypothetical protein
MIMITNQKIYIPNALDFFVSRLHVHLSLMVVRRSTSLVVIVEILGLFI